MKNTKGGKNIEIFFTKRLSLADKYFFASNLSMMLHSGLSITEALEVINEQSNGFLKKVVEDILDSVSSGSSLADSLQRHPKSFSGLFANIVKAGELSGNLEENLKNLAKQLEKDKEMIEKIKNAMVYPMVVLFMSFLIGIGLSLMVLPKITPIFEGLKVDLPLSTKILISFSKFVENNKVLFLLETFGSLFFMLWIVKQKFIKPLTHYILFLIPLVKTISKNSNTARFSRTLSSLLKSGIPINEALLITADTLGNHYYKIAVKEISLKVASGSKLSEAIIDYKKHFSKLTSSMIRVSEEAGTLEETLENLAKINENKLDQSTKRIAVVIEPLLLVFVGLIVAWVAVSIISPIYQITGSVYK